MTGRAAGHTTRTHARRLAWMLAPALLPAACGGYASPSAPSPSVAGVAVANEGWTHVPEGSPVTYRHNPPASGNHYPVWLRYEAYATALGRGYWVHNLEHGAVVLLHRPDAPAAGIAALRSAYASLPVDPACGHSRSLLTPDPELDVPFAAVAADWVLEMQQVDATAIRAFVQQHRGRAPENVCEGGTRP